MVKVLHSGRLGDAIYSLKAAEKIRERHDDDIEYYLCGSSDSSESDFYGMLKRLFLVQPKIASVKHFQKGIKDEDYHKLEIDYNLDNFRGINPWENHIILCHLQALHLGTKDWNVPWLQIPNEKSPNNKPFALLQRTFRYRNPKADWKGFMSKVKAEVGEDELYFVGTEFEFKNFTTTIEPKAKWLKVTDMLDFAEYMKAASWVGTGMSVGLVLAQGMGKKHFFELEPRHVKTVCTGREDEFTI